MLFGAGKHQARKCELGGAILDLTCDISGAFLDSQRRRAGRLCLLGLKLRAVVLLMMVFAARRCNLQNTEVRFGWGSGDGGRGLSGRLVANWILDCLSQIVTFRNSHHTTEQITDFWAVPQKS